MTPQGPRVLVAGVCGAGKTTMAAALATRYGLPHHELDALFHGPGWVKRPEFEADVHAFAHQGRWVCEDQYDGYLGDLLWERANRLVWVDMPYTTVMRRVVGRSLVRLITRRTLWNGNRERWRSLLFDPKHPARFALSHHASHRADVAARLARHPELVVVRLTSAAEADRWFDSLPEPEFWPATDDREPFSE
ncbi:adenylate kinase [Streptomyces sp. NPDC001339]|uniref:adenylate kinase n=1 Tax=Streptomyces sp. NPDC001339 TaxID=3364563 RepID=UPI0036A7CD54